jgi:hypothetical protein
MIGRLTWLLLPMAMLVPRSAAAARANADESADQSASQDPDASADEQAELHKTAAPAKAESDDQIHWQFGIALTAVSYQRADFHVEPMNSGQSLPGTLERTNYGPSGGSVVLEPGYVIGNKLVLGMLLDIGSGLDESLVKDLSFKIEQSGASFAVGPRVAYYLAPTSRLRPFGTLAFGYTFTPSKQAGQGIRLTMYQGFAGIGLSYFALPFFSFDTSLRAAYGIGSGYVDTGVLKNAGLSGSIYTVMWMIGTTGWLM